MAGGAPDQDEHANKHEESACCHKVRRHLPDENMTASRPYLTAGAAVFFAKQPSDEDEGLGITRNAVETDRLL